LGEVAGVGIGDDAQGLVAECELGVAEQGRVGSGDQPAGHLQDGGGRPGRDPGGQFLGLGFQLGAERLGHGGASYRGKSGSSV
jgi:hypothetical protein